MNNEALTATARRAAALAGRFLRWWGGELAGLVPRRLRRRLTAASPTLRFELLGTRLLLRTRLRGRRRTLGSWDLGAWNSGTTGPGLADEVRRVVRGAGLKHAPVVLRPTPEQVFRRPIALPEQAEENLRDILAFEIDRHTPFRPDRVFTAHRIVGRHPDQERIQVDLIVVPRRHLAPVLTAIAGAGLPAPMVEIPAPRASGRPLVPSSADEENGARRSWLTAGATALTLALLAASMAVRLDRLGAEGARLDDALHVAMAEADKADRLREEIDSLARETAVLLDRKRNAPPLLAVLNKLARLLPDHSWVQELRVRGAEIQISGQSASAAGLVELVEYSPMFRKANFTSPITRSPNEERERFHLVFEVEPLRASKLAERTAGAP